MYLLSAILPVLHISFFVLILRPPPTSTLFPYTTLFRSLLEQLLVLLGDLLDEVLPPLGGFLLVGLGDGPLDEAGAAALLVRSEEHTSELQSQSNLVCRLLLEKKK